MQGSKGGLVQQVPPVTAAACAGLGVSSAPREAPGSPATQDISSELPGSPDELSWPSQGVLLLSKTPHNCPWLMGQGELVCTAQNPQTCAQGAPARLPGTTRQRTSAKRLLHVPSQDPAHSGAEPMQGRSNGAVAFVASAQTAHPAGSAGVQQGCARLLPCSSQVGAASNARP